MNSNPSVIRNEQPFPEGAEAITCQHGLYYKQNIEGRFQDGFMILAGTDAGQVLCISPDNLEKRHMILQAHAAPIQLILVSRDNSMLFSFDKKTFKIWAVKFGEPGKRVQGLDNPLPTLSVPSLELVSMKETSSVFSNVMAADEVQKTIAIASTNSKISFYSYENDRISQLRQKGSGQENHTGSITAIDACEKLGLFASSSKDGSVKIWKDARLIRYCQRCQRSECEAHCIVQRNAIWWSCAQLSLCK
jgi:WD40 repeat protein